MRVPFRQGIVRCLNAGFLTVVQSYVTLNVLEYPTVVTFAHGSVDYLFVEQSSVANAWGPIQPGVDQWLYWDLDVRTAVRTFGITIHRPLAQPNPPAGPAQDQHWFNTSTCTMNVWNSTANRWTERIRVFACVLQNGITPLSISAVSPDFKGTQVGIFQSCLAGTILKDPSSGSPIRTSDYKFLTGETKLQAITGATSGIRTEALIVEAEAQENMSAYTVVRFSDFGKIVAADQFTADSPQQFGIIESNVNIGDIVTVTTTGVVSRPSWEWTAVNALLYADNYGQLSTVPIGRSTSIGIVIDINKILLFASNRVGSLGLGGSTEPATTGNIGSVTLSVPPMSAVLPVAVGDNDPRVVNALNTAGGVMTGQLTLVGNPMSPNHAASKAYVDAHSSALAGLNTNGITIHNGTTFTTVALTEPASGLTITNPTGVGGNPTFAFTDELAQLIGLTTGMVVKTGAGTLEARTIQPVTNQTIVQNDTGVSGNPTIGLADNTVLPGTGAVTIPIGSSGQQPSGSAGMLRYSTTLNKFEFYEGGSWVSYGTSNAVGTVTSVALALPSMFTVSGSPVTHDGTLAASLASQTANSILAAPSGVTGVPTFRSLTALDIPVLNWSKITSGQPTTLGGYGITDAVATTVRVIAGAGLSGGGTLSGSVTVALNASLDNLSDVVITAPATGHVLYYNGTAFVNTALGAGSGVQPYDATLSALSGLDATSGVVVQTGTDTFTKRTIAGATGRITVADGTGVANDPTVDLASGVATPGTYSSVTVDTYGRVIAGTSAATNPMLLMTNANVSAIVIGTPVYVSVGGSVDKANAGAASTTKTIGFVADDSINAGAVGNITVAGIITATTGQWDAITGQTGGLTGGATYFLSAITAGTITTNVATGGGEYVAAVGSALNSTQMKININPTIQL